MGCETCGPNEAKKVTYVCSAGADKCPPKEVAENTPAPECCGKPMVKKTGCCG
ncbi:MAG: hypothetical protein KAS70_01620 [Planctomycetes bacterium]|nr:hypothetical protein [Planctomycetota bacterium]MCK5578011.1 hypothetical protein [Planctomycetota bacterium]